MRELAQMLPDTNGNVPLRFIMATSTLAEGVSAKRLSLLLHNTDSSAQFNSAAACVMLKRLVVFDKDGAASFGQYWE